MSRAGASVGAVLLCLMGGIMNCTWPLFCKPESPKTLRVVSAGGWEWENVWLVFIVWSTLLNVLYCLGLAGPSKLMTVYESASLNDLTLVCIFSFLWGSGTMCYSLGVQMLGAGPGIALVMSLLVVIGTLLPLIEDHADNADSPAALVTILGLVFAISGFVTSAYSSHIKDRAKIASTDGISNNTNADADDKKNASGGGPATISSADPELATDVTVHLTDDSAVGATGGTSTPYSGSHAVSGANPIQFGGKLHKSGSIGNAIHLDEGNARAAITGGAVTLTHHGKNESVGPKKGNHLKGIAVCALGAIMSSMLQFAFVYGAPLVSQANEEEGMPGIVAPLVIWLLAFSFAGLWNVIYACYLLSSKGTWGRYMSTSGRDIVDHSVRLTVMSVFFVGHIHLYGIAQFLFGGLGPVIAWPLLMSSTVLGGQLWGVWMKEWVGVPVQAVCINVASISLLVMAVIIIAIAGAVL